MMAAHGHKTYNKDKWHITGKVIIGDLLKVCPEAEEVFKKHLGPSCLSIPGTRTESIEFLAAMHDYHEEPLLEELNKVCKTSPTKIGHF